MARWLVHSNTWGVVSTTSRHLGGVAFGNVASYSDGPRGQPTGRLLFYLSESCCCCCCPSGRVPGQQGTSTCSDTSHHSRSCSPNFAGC